MLVKKKFISLYRELKPGVNIRINRLGLVLIYKIVCVNDFAQVFGSMYISVYLQRLTLSADKDKIHTSKDITTDLLRISKDGEKSYDIIDTEDRLKRILSMEELTNRPFAC